MSLAKVFLMASSPASGKVWTFYKFPGSTAPKMKGWSSGSILLSIMFAPKASVLAIRTNGHPKISA